MAKRSSYDIKEKILMLVKEKPETYAHLERKLSTGFRTIKNNCKELEKLGLLNVQEQGKNPANGRPYFQVSLTNQGMKLVDGKKSK